MEEDDYDEEEVEEKEVLHGDAKRRKVGSEAKELPTALAPTPNPSLLVPKSEVEGKDLRDEKKAEGDPKEDGARNKAMAAMQERNNIVLAQLTEDQMSRYESFRRSAFQRSIVRKILTDVTGSTASLPMTIVMCGIAKLFVGDLVETSRIIMSERGDTGPIQPIHLREAYERLRSARQIPIRGRVPRLFR